MVRAISNDLSMQLASYSSDYCKGVVTGPTRTLLGLMQTVVNVVGLFFSPLTYFCRKEDSPWSASNTFNDALGGLGHAFTGVIEFLPCSSFYLARPNDQEKYIVKQLSHWIREEIAQPDSKHVGDEQYSFDDSTANYHKICKLVSRKFIPAINVTCTRDANLPTKHTFHWENLN